MKTNEIGVQTVESKNEELVQGIPVVHRGKFIKQFSGPDDDGGIVCFKFWELVAAAGCVFDCVYCFLANTLSFKMGRYPLSGVIFSNWQDMREEIKEWLRFPMPRMMIVGELQDGLVFDGVYKAYAGQSLTEMVVPLFGAQDCHQLIFLTKSVNIQHLMAMDATPQVIISWSINTEEAGKLYEHGAPLPSQRLDAARKLKKRGWRIRFRLDPMIPYSGWRNGYAEIIDQINALEPEMVTIGALRASQGLVSSVKRVGRDASVFQMLSEKDPSGFKFRLPFETQLELFRFALDRLDRSRIVPALCKEDRTVWKALGLPFNGCHCLLGRGDEVVQQRWVGPSPV